MTPVLSLRVVKGSEGQVLKTHKSLALPPKMICVAICSALFAAYPPCGNHGERSLEAGAG
jgi:hypothetical protein